jgi:hypothetical protein
VLEAKVRGDPINSIRRPPVISRSRHPWVALGEVLGCSLGALLRSELGAVLGCSLVSLVGLVLGSVLG